MTSETVTSPMFVRLFSWSCAFTVLIVSLGSARFAFHRLPLLALLALTVFKLASMFYVAGRLMERIWCSVTKVTSRALLRDGDSEVSHE